MKLKILNLLLVLSSLTGYLEWGGGNRMFLIEGEIEIISKAFKDPLSVLHPLTLIPFIGQILLIITLFQKVPGKRMTYIGIGAIGILFIMILLTGLLGKNVKVVVSTIPFFVLGFIAIRNYRRGGDHLGA